MLQLKNHPCCLYVIRQGGCRSQCEGSLFRGCRSLCRECWSLSTERATLNRGFPHSDSESQFQFYESWFYLCLRTSKRGGWSLFQGGWSIFCRETIFDLFLDPVFNFLSCDFQVRWLPKQRNMRSHLFKQIRHHHLGQVSGLYSIISTVNNQGSTGTRELTILTQVMEQKPNQSGVTKEATAKKII